LSAAAAVPRSSNDLPVGDAGPAAAGAGKAVGEALLEVLVAAGVREFFGVPGAGMTPLLGAVDAQPSVRYVGVRHEFAAATMAAAIYQSTGRVAVCLGEQGPGALNLISGLGVARNNNLAVVALTVSGPSASPYGSGALMELDALLASRAVTKWQHAVRRPDDAVPALREALRQATSGRPGPVHLDIPREVLRGRILSAPGGTGSEPAPEVAPIDRAQLAGVVRLLLSAERPLVVAGGGAAHAHAEDVLRQIADHLGAVTTSTQLGIGVMPSDGPLFAGHGGVIAGPALIRAAREADVVLAVGCRFSSWWWQDAQPLVRDATLVHVDTDPELVARSGAGGGYGLLGDARVVLEQVWEALRFQPRQPPGAWAEQVRAEFVTHRARLDVLADDRPGGDSPSDDTAMAAHPAALARQLGELIADDDLVVLDGGHTAFWSNDFTPAVQPRTVVHEPGMGHLGFAMPCANALALAHPHRRVLTITGDGAFGFSVAELDTARRLGLRTITVIHNNALWGIISVAQRRAGFSMGTDLSGTDYAAVAAGFGCVGIRVENLDDLASAFGEARSSHLPVVLDVRVRFEPHPMLADFGRTTEAPS